MAPRISVRTQGPSEWSIAVHQLSAAEDVRDNFRQRGLLCGRISQDGNQFVFTVDGQSQLDQLRSQSHPEG